MNNKLCVKICVCNERKPSDKQMEHSIDLFRGMVADCPGKAKKLVADVLDRVIDCWLGGKSDENERVTTTEEDHRNHRAGEIFHQGAD